jgi:TDG/mug DNA glycosylase family protein
LVRRDCRTKNQNGLMSRRSGAPTREELDASEGKTVPDVIAMGLDVLFCGVNPGLWSAAVQHHFARPGNRFWKALHLSGFTEDLVSPADERDLMERGIGITNVVDKATRSAAELRKADLQEGALLLEAKVRRWNPRVVAVLGMGAYRTAFSRPLAEPGLQPELLAGANLWLLPNPSGAQARYQIADLVEQLKELRAYVSG